MFNHVIIDFPRAYCFYMKVFDISFKIVLVCPFNKLFLPGTIRIVSAGCVSKADNDLLKKKLTKRPFYDSGMQE